MKGTAKLPATARVLVVDDHPITLQGVRRVLEDVGVTEIHEATDPVVGYRLFHRVRPDIAVVDLAYRGKGLSGLSLIRRMRALEPKARILVLSMHHDPVIASHALKQGAGGFTFKDLPAQDFLEAVIDVYQNRPHLPQTLALAILGNIKSDLGKLCEKLSTREIEILALVIDGLNHKSISKALSLGYRSVISTVSDIRSKTGERDLRKFSLDDENDIYYQLDS